MKIFTIHHRNRGAIHDVSLYSTTAIIDRVVEILGIGCLTYDDPTFSSNGCSVERFRAALEAHPERGYSDSIDNKLDRLAELVEAGAAWEKEYPNDIIVIAWS